MLHSVHTSNLSPLLQQLGISLMVTTYQAGKLVMLRADGEAVNTHFRAFNAPMGLAFEGHRLALGTSVDIWEFHNVPAVAAKLDPPGKHDACFLPRSSVITGNVQIHELAWGHDDLWFVNTRFSCLAQRHSRYSFVPRWRPPFITAIAPEDRCHLKGLAMVDGEPRFVTALAMSNEPAGWRPHKRDGGVLMEVPVRRSRLSWPVNAAFAPGL